MPKFDFKKKLNEAGKKAGESIQKGVQAAKDFDVKETVSNAGKIVGDVADNVKNYDIKNMPGDLKDMAVDTGKAAKRFVVDAKETNKDVKKALKDLTKKEKDTNVSLIEACHIFYLLMAIDGKVTEEESSSFKEITDECKVSADDYNKIVSKGKSIIKKAKDDGDFVDVIKEEAISILKEEKKSDQNISKKKFLWNLIVLAHADHDYSEEESKFIRSIARVLEIDKAIVSEMEFYNDTLNKLMKDISTNAYYKREVEARRNIIMNSVHLLIEDKEA